MRAAVSLGLGALACLALAVIGGWWGGHWPAALATMGWYAAAAAYAAFSWPRRDGIPGAAVPLGAWFAVVALLATIVFAATWAGLAPRWFWSCQVLLAALLALAWTSALGLAEPPPPAAPEVPAKVPCRQRLAAELRQLALAVRRNAAAEAVAFVRAADALADEVRSLPSTATAQGVGLLLADIAHWIEDAARAAGPGTGGDQLQVLSHEAAVLRHRLAQWRRS